jgi:hypothetical protein
LSGNVLILRIRTPALEIRAAFSGINLIKEIPMKKSIAAFVGIASITVAGWSQVVIYDDATPTIKAEWIHGGGSLNAIATDGYESTKCLDWSFNSGDIALRSTSAAYEGWIPAKKFKYFQFAVKASNPDKISKAEVGFWCIHCAPDGGDAFFPQKTSFTPTAEWKVISMPLSVWATNKLDSISCIMMYMTTSAGGHLYIDNIKFTDAEIVSVRPAAHAPASAGQVLFPTGGKVKVEVFSLTGAIISSRMVDVAANTVYQASRFTARDLPAGAYLVRQSVLNGANASLVEANRLLVTR